ncbi:hypothetical protein KGD82_27605 (plasmid) [Nocardiopsis eucommiae]|uniref:Uncharacterized protein n=1 Tax=Nocardiopsis eucommiae TaxID=2831970 RepID=A0A975QL60_9ACTN|nr:hypothetical protein KGD82_27605 [Nocardiopsis eucommiae]
MPRNVKYFPVDSLYPEFPIAVEILCSAERGRCRRPRAFALAFPERPYRPDGDEVVLLLTTEHTAFSGKDYGGGKSGVPLEDVVPDDFRGATDIVICSKFSHNTLVTGAGAERTQIFGQIGMPLELLRPCYEAYQRGGGTRQLRWRPEAQSAIDMGTRPRHLS